IPWIAALKDVAPEDEARIKAQLEADDRLGSSPSERRTLMVRAKAFARYGTWAAFAIAGWVLLFPKPYELAIATVALTPLVALAIGLRYAPLFDFDDTN